MPQIILKQPGQPVASFAIDGATITVAGHTVDCAQRQRDTAQTVEVRWINGTAAEGDSGPYLAQIDIPARRYELRAAPDADPANPDGGPVTGTAGSAAQATREPMPLDPNSIVVTLWPFASAHIAQGLAAPSQPL